jgi:hypothetical protein
MRALRPTPICQVSVVLTDVLVVVVPPNENEVVVVNSPVDFATLTSGRSATPSVTCQMTPIDGYPIVTPSLGLSCADAVVARNVNVTAAINPRRRTVIGPPHRKYTRNVA